MKKREIKYDYLRAIAVIAIMMAHAVPTEAVNDKQWWFAAAVIPVLLCFVGIYFMLSGLFLLESGTGSISEFYRNRFKSIGIPFLFFSLVYYGYDAFVGKSSLTWWEHAGEFCREFLNGAIPQADHMWFMYVIIALYICTPFLARMMKALSDRELKYLLILMLTIQGLTVYLTAFGIHMEGILQYMVFKGWLIYFVLGYSLRRLGRKEVFPWFALAGAAGFVITLLQKGLVPWFVPGIHDLAPTMFAMATAIFLFFEYYGDWNVRGIREAASWMSRHSYSAYLAHYLILRQFAVGFVRNTPVRHFYVPTILCVTLLTAVISFGIAFILDETVFKWIRNGIWPENGEKMERSLENGRQL